MSKADGTLDSSITFYPFGATRTGSVNTTKEFTGQRLDSTGLYYYNARYYDATIGRFVSPDSTGQKLENPQSLNRYTYCLNNPLNRTDPTGHWPNWVKMLNTVGQFCAGVGEGIIGTVKATAQMVVNPVQTAQAIGYAVTHPAETVKAIGNQLASETGSARGIGNIVGQVIGTVAIGYATAGVGSAVAQGLEALATLTGASGIASDAINTVAGATRVLTGAATPKVFYSGGAAARTAAEEFAAASGGTTLSMTIKGKLLSAGAKVFGDDAVSKAVSSASRSFAENASGAVHVFINPKYYNPGSIWGTVERDVLMNNGNDIIYHSIGSHFLGP